MKALLSKLYLNWKLHFCFFSGIGIVSQSFDSSFNIKPMRWFIKNFGMIWQWNSCENLFRLSSICSLELIWMELISSSERLYLMSPPSLPKKSSRSPFKAGKSSLIRSFLFWMYFNSIPKAAMQFYDKESMISSLSNRIYIVYLNDLSILNWAAICNVPSGDWRDFISIEHGMM